MYDWWENETTGLQSHYLQSKLRRSFILNAHDTYLHSINVISLLQCDGGVVAGTEDVCLPQSRVSAIFQ